ncbi:MAG: DUF488 family protein [Flavobacteriales bacterium]|nr:DUF488 family protein [Flavobacteriales bacterium]
MQKILFLVTRKQEKKAYDFVPYKFGSFSFQANQDLTTLTKKNFLSQNDQLDGTFWKTLTEEKYFHQLKVEDQSAIIKTRNEVKNLSNNELIRLTYINYPYWAIKSQIASKLLEEAELEKVHSQKRCFTDQELFTIGYEGLSLETYLNKLIINDVKILCDVRKNALSMKYGFSKNQLQNACESIDIKYVHIPQLGIDSDKRTSLNTLSDYKKLFNEYERTTLIQNRDYLEKLLELLDKYNRVALTCFEKDSCMCHRSSVAKALHQVPKRNLKLTDL